MIVFERVCPSRIVSGGGSVDALNSFVVVIAYNDQLGACMYDLNEIGSLI